MRALMPLSLTSSQARRRAQGKRNRAITSVNPAAKASAAAATARGQAVDISGEPVHGSTVFCRRTGLASKLSFLSTGCHGTETAFVHSLCGSATARASWTFPPYPRFCRALLASMTMEN
jgi:hypothetical protein